MEMMFVPLVIFLPFADITNTTPVTPLIRMSIVQAD